MDTEKYTQKSMKALQEAQSLAVQYGNAEITALHLAYALLERDGTVYKALLRAQTDADGLQNAVKEEVERLPRMSGAAANIYPSAALQRILPEGRSLPIA